MPLGLGYGGSWRHRHGRRGARRLRGIGGAEGEAKRMREAEEMKVWIVVIIAAAVGCGGRPFGSPLFSETDGAGGEGGSWDGASSSSSASTSATSSRASSGSSATAGAGGAGGDGEVAASSSSSSSSVGVGGSGTTWGPLHTFSGLTASLWVTAVGCSMSGGDAAGDAAWFCHHVYGGACEAVSWTPVVADLNPRMHPGSNCYAPDPAGFNISGTVCVGGPCKIGDYNDGAVGGLVDLVCHCP